jgi:hypothetical protein
MRAPHELVVGCLLTATFCSISACSTAPTTPAAHEGEDDAGEPPGPKPRDSGPPDASPRKDAAADAEDGEDAGAPGRPDAEDDGPADAPPLPQDAPPASDGSARGAHAAIVWGYGEERPTPSPTDPLMPLDLTMKARLEAKGLIVDTFEDKASTAADVMGHALVVISNSVDRRNLFDAAKKPKFRDVPVPAIVMKDGVIEVMGMGTGSSGGFSTPVGQTQIAIVAPGDALAAGLMGNVTVYTKMSGAPCPPCYLRYLQSSDRLIYAFPGPEAKTIATIIGKANESAIFAYPAGAKMIGGAVAPAKRMGFFIHRDTDYSADGIKLFDAAVDYLLTP